ncbi:hypothetical protein EDC01DRAFT_636767 [Geopyxis carbonaria]|nr:hypothetical protein EDC01DRAFT_636767 [Geopyxis carbonaria]
MEINLLLNEQRHLLPYIRLCIDGAGHLNNNEDPQNYIDEDEDGSIMIYRLWMRLIDLRKKSGAAMAHVPKEKPDTPNNEICHMNGPDMPTSFTKWRSATIRAIDDDPEYKVTSWDMRVPNMTRCASYIRYEEAGRSFFGMVQFFFTVDIDRKIHLLAYIEKWAVQADEHLVYKASSGHRHVVINSSNLKELIALILWREKHYLVRKQGPVESFAIS